jgi:hypothetical protein
MIQMFNWVGIHYYFCWQCSDYICRRTINKGIDVDNMHYLIDGLCVFCSCVSYILPSYLSCFRHIKMDSGYHPKWPVMFFLVWLLWMFCCCLKEWNPYATAYSLYNLYKNLPYWLAFFVTLEVLLSTCVFNASLIIVVVYLYCLHEDVQACMKQLCNFLPILESWWNSRLV